MGNLFNCYESPLNCSTLQCTLYRNRAHQGRAVRSSRDKQRAPPGGRTSFELASHSSHTSLQQSIIHSYPENNNSPQEGDKGVN